jgi:hypothetical protein
LILKIENKVVEYVQKCALSFRVNLLQITNIYV